jgi:hypothetical protein
MNHRDVDWLLGRRFSCDFTVLAVADDADRTVTLEMQPDKQRYQISFEELMTVVERGFVTDGPYSEQALRRAEVKERLALAAYDRLHLCPDHRDKASGTRCIVCDGERRGREDERARQCNTVRH